MNDPGEINAFLQLYWADHEAGQVRALGAYLARFPGAEEILSREYVALEGGRWSSGNGTASAFGENGCFGTYHIVREIARGGQGTVYLAEEPALNRKVALKVLRETGPVTSAEMLKRFQREAELAGKLDHPGICPIHAAGIIQGTAYIAMRFIEGQTLGNLISKARDRDDRSTVISLAPEESPKRTDETQGEKPPSGPSTRNEIHRVIGIVEQAGRALHVAHEAGIIHRDIKPGNVMVTPEGGAVILDFGLARDEESMHSELTRTGDLFGTPHYMSPEQISGHKRIHLDRRTDVYSLGVTLYECLTLSRPFEAPTRQSLYEAIQFKTLPDPRIRNPAISRDLKVVLETALEKDRARRYQTALDFAEDLRRVRTFEPIAARPAGPILRLRRWVQRNPVVATATLAVLFLLILGLIISIAALQTVRAERNRAEKAILERDQAMSDLDRALGRFEAQTDQISVLLRQAEKLWPALTSSVQSFDRWLAEFDHLASIGTGVQSEAVKSALPRLLELANRIRVRRDEKLRPYLDAVESHRQEWETTVRSVSDEVENRVYHGLEIEPMPGLVPLGRDPDSRLHEFGDVQTGTLPVRGADGKLRITDESGMVFVLIPGGAFTMGSQNADNGGRNHDPDMVSNERPPQDLRLDAFLLAKYETTQGQWSRIMDQNPSIYAPGRTPAGTGTAAGRTITWRNPVESLSWNDAGEFCRRLGFQMPTEAQWEYARRSLRMTGSLADTLRGHANIADEGSQSHFPPTFAKEPGFIDGHGVHAPVGSFLPDSFGLHDMAGNVWEWCRDTYVLYQTQAPAPGDGLRSESPGEHVYRGGSFITLAGACRAAARASANTDQRQADLGLRPCKRME